MRTIYARYYVFTFGSATNSAANFAANAAAQAVVSPRGDQGLWLNFRQARDLVELMTAVTNNAALMKDRQHRRGAHKALLPRALFR